MSELMQVCVHLPGRLLYSGAARHVYAESEQGAFGLLPRHRDLVSTLRPSVLILRDAKGRELFFGIDQGVLVKHDERVDVMVQRAVQGDELDSLAVLVAEAFSELDEEERKARTALSRLEAGMVRRLTELRTPL